MRAQITLNIKGNNIPFAQANLNHFTSILSAVQAWIETIPGVDFVEHSDMKGAIEGGIIVVTFNVFDVNNDRLKSQLTGLCRILNVPAICYEIHWQRRTNVDILGVAFSEANHSGVYGGHFIAGNFPADRWLTLRLAASKSQRLHRVA